MLFDNNTICKNQDFILDINKFRDSKLDRLFQLIEMKPLDISEPKNIEIITNCIMRKTKKSDEAFLHWLFLIGEHINLRFNTQWALARFNIASESDCRLPILLNSEKDIWLVGMDCATCYYGKKRLYNISFNTFYKTHIDKIFGKSKLHNYEKAIQELLILE